MPLGIVRASDNEALWSTCADRFIARASGSAGPAGHTSYIWLRYRYLRDLLLDRAQKQGNKGWLNPPIAFLGDLARVFDIREKPIGLLTRRRLVSRLAAEHGLAILGREPGRADGVIRGHMLDSVLADLLPEDIAPENLRKALAQLNSDDFAQRRNEWVIAVYSAYLAELQRLGLRDPRSINALIAERIEAGQLARILGDSSQLYIYGVTEMRNRRRLFLALAAQEEVEVELYLPLETEPDEFATLTDDVEILPEPVAPRHAPSATPGSGGIPGARVQPVPDVAREMEWAARQVKKILTEGEVEPHELAVVARTGRDDVRRACHALEKAGVPCTARIRTPLSEIPALKALLAVFRGAARDWDSGSLRAVLDHPYFAARVDLRAIDFIAEHGRVSGLSAWDEKLAKLLERLRANEEAEKADRDRSLRRSGLFVDRLEKDLVGFRSVRAALEPLSLERTEAEWLELTLRLVHEDRGFLLLRRRVCDPVADRWDVVRLDQRGLVQLERLLREWLELDHPDKPMQPAGWHALLRRLLESSELALATPSQKGVQVLEAHDAALIPFGHTFVLHANDGEFPSVLRQTGVLNDEERTRLTELGIPFTHREETLRRERTLWRAVTQQAGPVTISYRTTEPDGTPLLPSLMVPEHDHTTELPRVRRPQSEEPAVSDFDADRLAAYALAEAMRDDSGRPVIIAPADSRQVRQAVVAAVAESHRGPGLERAAGGIEHVALRPNPWNGEIRDPDVLAWLEGRFGEGYWWSAGALERYARAPFLFFVERALGLREYGEAEEETTPLTIGGVAHEILEKFYGALGQQLPISFDAATAALLDEVIDEACGRREQKGDWLGLPSLWAVTRATVRQRVRDYVDWELEHLNDKGERPLLVEESFGFEQEVWIEGTDFHGRPARFRICGRIDRVDEAGKRKIVHHVLDYKNNRLPSRGGYLDGSTLQGALYTRVLDDRGLAMGKSRYRSIKNPGDPKNGCEIKIGSNYYDAAIAIALTIPSRVLAGWFEPVMAKASDWLSWDPGLEIRRNDAKLPGGNRFELDAMLERAATRASDG